MRIQVPGLKPELETLKKEKTMMKKALMALVALMVCAAAAWNWGSGRHPAAGMEPHGKLTALYPELNVARLYRYKSAMAHYNRSKRYFTQGQFIDIGGDETLHMGVNMSAKVVIP